MHAHVSVPLLETVVFTDEVQIITTDDNSTMHLHFTHNTSQDTTTDGNVSREWAFLVDVSSGDGLKRTKPPISFIVPVLHIRK